MTIGTIAVGLFLLVLVAFVIWTMIRDKKAGKHICGGCGGDCASCEHCVSAPSSDKSMKS